MSPTDGDLPLNVDGNRETSDPPLYFPRLVKHQEGSSREEEGCKIVECFSKTRVYFIFRNPSLPSLFSNLDTRGKFSVKFIFLCLHVFPFFPLVYVTRKMFIK